MKSPIRGVGGASFVSPGSGEPYAADAATRECAAMQPPPRRPPPGLYFPSPSCCSATRSISVAATPPAFSNLPMMNRKHLTSGVLTDKQRSPSASHLGGCWCSYTHGDARRARRDGRVFVYDAKGTRWATRSGTATPPRSGSGAVALDSPRESTQPERHDVHVHDHLVHGTDRREGIPPVTLLAGRWAFTRTSWASITPGRSPTSPWRSVSRPARTAGYRPRSP